MGGFNRSPLPSPKFYASKFLKQTKFLVDITKKKHLKYIFIDIKKSIKN